LCKDFAPLNNRPVPIRVADQELNAVNHDEETRDDDASILNFELDDTAIELAATGVGTIPTASVNMVPPNCCVQQRR
jgi:hypothetical protein